VRAALEEISIEASVDLLDSGITLSGGLARLHGLAEHFALEFGLHVQVAPDPTLAAATGAGRLIEQPIPAFIREAMREEESVRATNGSWPNREDKRFAYSH
jgi:actin-like ATPase involved in cell morphogenesis